MSIRIACACLTHVSHGYLKTQAGDDGDDDNESDILIEFGLAGNGI